MPRVRRFRDPRELRSLVAHLGSIGFRIKHELGNLKTWTTRPRELDHGKFVQWGKRSLDRHLRRKDENGILLGDHPPTTMQGLTVGVKDNIVTTSLPSSCASNILRGYVAPEKATVVELMENAGMFVTGKTNMDEFGMGSHNLNSAFGAMSQPYTRHSVGGSSGGSALALARKECHIAIGTDTGGSVRLPAAYLNLCGFKPSYGLISRYGVIPYANSLDTVGIISKDPIDAFLLFEVLSQPDARDPTCLTEASRERIRKVRALRVNSKRQDQVRVVTDAAQYSRQMAPSDIYRSGNLDLQAETTHYDGIYSDFGHRHIGIPTDYNIAELQPEVRNAWKVAIATLREQGHVLVPIDLPTTQHALSAYYILAPAEASSNLAKYDGIRYGPVRDSSSANRDNGTLYSDHRGALFGDEVQRRILLGAFSLSASSVDNYFLQAQRVRRLVQEDFNQVFRMPHPLLQDSKAVENGVDYILCPTAPSFPPNVEKLKDASPPEGYMNDVFTVPASLAGLPAMTVPAPPAPGKRVNDTTRSVGIQVIGQYGDDIGVIQFVNRNLWRNSQWVAEKVGNTLEGPKL